MKHDRERVKSDLREAISMICKAGLQYFNELSIEGLLGITLDRNEVFLISISDIVNNSDDIQCMKAEDLTQNKRKINVRTEFELHDDVNTPLDLASKRKKVTDVTNDLHAHNNSDTSANRTVKSSNCSDSSNDVAVSRLKSDSRESFSESENEFVHEIAPENNTFHHEFNDNDAQHEGSEHSSTYNDLGDENQQPPSANSRESTPIPNLRRMLNPKLPSKVIASTNNTPSPQHNSLYGSPGISIKQEQEDGAVETKPNIGSPGFNDSLIAGDALALAGLSPQLFTTQQGLMAMPGMPVFPGMPEIFQNPSASTSAVQQALLNPPLSAWRGSTPVLNIPNSPRNHSISISQANSTSPVNTPGRNSNQGRSDLACANCGTNQTTMWRRNEEGLPVCNPCGLYFKLHQKNRPLEYTRKKIQVRRRRTRFTSLQSPNSSGNGQEGVHGNGQEGYHGNEGGHGNNQEVGHDNSILLPHLLTTPKGEPAAASSEAANLFPAPPP